MRLEWKKRSGKSECGKYVATAHSAYFMGTLLGSVFTQSESRAICQRNAWKISAEEAINRTLRMLATATQTGAAVLSHALKVDSSQVSRWKLGRALVPADHCERIAELCGVASITPDLLRPDLYFWRGDGFGLRWSKRSTIAGGGEL
jgi:DNA-binding transcriptional regulator YdaS (Cro superfamily)